ncbi:MAG: hypothetical protein LBN07_03475 [Christensenellaceae bacterium]|nr:hypothetical protein [Christensenellaceae bacterium]
MQKYYVTHNSKLNQMLLFKQTLEKASSAVDPSIGKYNYETYSIKVFKPPEASAPPPTKFEQIGLMDYTLYLGNKEMDTGGYFYRVNIKPEYQKNGIFTQLFGLAQNHMIESNAVSFNFFIGSGNECLTDEQLNAGTDIECLPQDTLSKIYSKFGVRKSRDNNRERYKFLTPEDYLPLEELGIKVIESATSLSIIPYAQENAVISCKHQPH